MENQIVSGVLVILSFLGIAVLSSILLKKIHFPYTIGLVLVGGVLGLLSYHSNVLEIFRQITLSPDIILYIILPALVFDAAINIDYHVLYKNLVPILLLAVIGLLISAGVIGVGVSIFTTLPFIGALVFGALISATDPVAVIALFNEIGAPKRLVTLIDGESIFNDATAIVLFTIVMAAAAHPGAAHVNLLGASWSFVAVLLGGVLVGAVIGAAGSLLNGFMKKDIILQITVSLIMAYLSFVTAGYIFHFSGVMATLAAGIMMSASIEKTFKRSNIETIGHFWEYFSFIANSIVFLLLGLTEFHILKRNVTSNEFAMILYVIPVVLAARILGIYTLIPLYNFVNRKKEKKKISSGFQAILFWGGLRGAVPVALVLAIPQTFPHRNLIVHFTLSYILFTLLFQGTTIKTLMNKLGIRPETSFFGDREVDNVDYDFRGEGLAQLVMHKLRDLFDNEGFFIRENSSADTLEYLMKRQGTMFQIIQEQSRISLTTEPKDVSYFKTAMYEALLELDTSLEEIKSATNPKKMKELVAADGKAPEDKKAGFQFFRYLSKNRLLLDIKANNKEGVITELVEHLVKVNAIPYDMFKNVLEEVLQREKSMTTALGNEIAIPHSRSAFVKKMIVLIALAPRGIDFEAMDGKPVKIFILILSPRKETGPHLQMIATLTRILSDENTRKELLASTSTDELYQKIENRARQKKTPG